MLKYVRSLPCVASAEVDTVTAHEYHAWIRMNPKKGVRIGVELQPPPELRGREPIVPASTATTTSGAIAVATQPGEQNDNLELNRAEILRLLAANNAVFRFSEEGSSIMWGQFLVAQRFPIMLSQLRSDGPRDEKIGLLKDLGINLDPDVVVDGFKPSDQLDRRVNELVQSTGVKPWTLKDVKAEKERIDRLLHPTSGPTSRSMFRPALSHKPDPDALALAKLRGIKWKTHWDMLPLLTEKRSEVEDDLRSNMLMAMQIEPSFGQFVAMLNQRWTEKSAARLGEVLVDDANKKYGPWLAEPMYAYALLVYLRNNERPLAFKDGDRMGVSAAGAARVRGIAAVADRAVAAYYAKLFAPKCPWQPRCRKELLYPLAHALRRLRQSGHAHRRPLGRHGPRGAFPARHARRHRQYRGRRCT